MLFDTATGLCGLSGLALLLLAVGFGGNVLDAYADFVDAAAGVDLAVGDFADADADVDEVAALALGVYLGFVTTSSWFTCATSSSGFCSVTSDASVAYRAIGRKEVGTLRAAKRARRGTNIVGWYGELDMVSFKLAEAMVIISKGGWIDCPVGTVPTLCMSCHDASID
jgi:hypothetical protein